MRVLSTLIAVIVSCCSTAQSTTEAVGGRWKTIDDNTSLPKSVVELTIENGVLTGRIVDLFDKSKLGKVCDACPSDRHGQPIVGMEIIRGMRRDGREWQGGTILDPETGKLYDCRLWVENGQLKVRGYVAFFFRTQTWMR